MKNPLIIFYISFALLLQTSTLFADTKDGAILLQEDNFEHIEFSRINSNRHSFSDQQLKIEVDDSASFLMKPFVTVRQVKQVSVTWRSTGEPEIKNSKHEGQREGDDAVFKIGLLLSGEDSFPNPFLPSWMKRVDELLNHPSDNMIYLVANAKHKSGEQWINPYNKRVAMIAMDDVATDKGWHVSSYIFETPVNVVAVWLMADGDNTDSRFTVDIKSISVE